MAQIFNMGGGAGNFKILKFYIHFFNIFFQMAQNFTDGGVGEKFQMAQNL